MEIQYHGANAVKFTTKKSSLIVDVVSDISDNKLDFKKNNIILATQEAYKPKIVSDEQFLIDFLKEIESEHSIYKKKTFLKKTQKTYEGRVVKICRPKMVVDLTKHGVGPNKSKELSIGKH